MPPSSLPTRLGSFSQLLRIFDEVRQPHSSSHPGDASGDLKLCMAGDISVEEYLRRRIEVSLIRFAPHLDPDDLCRVRYVCLRYLRDDFVHTGMFRSILSRLRNTDKSGHI